MEHIIVLFIRPSSDGTYYGMVMSVRPTLRPSVRPGLRPPVFHTFLQHALTYWPEIMHMTLFYCTTDQVRVSSICVKFCGSYVPFVTYNTGNTQFSTLFSYMFWHIRLKFCIWFCYTVLQIKLECRQFASILVGVMPLLKLRILEIYSFPHFSLTFCIWLCFTVLQIKFECRQFASILVGVMPLLKLRILEIQFSALFSYILHITLFYCTTDQVRVSSMFYCTTDQVRVSSIFVGVMPLLELRILKIHSFSHFSPTCFDILSWNFAYDFVSPYSRSSSSVVNLPQFL